MAADTMTLLSGPAAVALSLLLVGLMGVAIQRGSTCLVAAVDEIVTQGSARRLGALVEAGLWVGAVTGLAMWVSGVSIPLPAAPPPGWRTVAGAILLGLGALLNRACIVGTIARIGSGEWAFLATPVGIFATSIAFAALGPSPVPTVPLAPNPLAGLAAATLLTLVLLPSIATLIRAGSRAARLLPVMLSGPHAATSCIGLCFAALALIGSPWNYSEALGHLARTGMADQPVLHLGLLAALLAGALLGGHLGGHAGPPPQRLIDVLRCLAGGATMAAGALLVPGSNDSLLLHAAPMLLPHALVALPVMAATIATGRLIRRQG